MDLIGGGACASSAEGTGRVESSSGEVVEDEGRRVCGEK